MINEEDIRRALLANWPGVQIEWIIFSGRPVGNLTISKLKEVPSWMERPKPAAQLLRREREEITNDAGVITRCQEAKRDE